MIDLTVSEMANGVIEERLTEELEKVLKNILDPNTEAKKQRKIKLELTIKPNEQRTMGEVVIATSSTLVSPKPVSTNIYMGADPKTGAVGASEINPAQPQLPNMEPERPQRGNVVNFQ